MKYHLITYGWPYVFNPQVPFQSKGKVIYSERSDPKAMYRSLADNVLIRMIPIAICLVFISLNLRAADTGSEATNTCDQSMKVSWGPCLEGIPSDIFNERKKVGLMPANNAEILGFQVGKHDFPDAMKILGKANQWHTGDAAASEDKVCYISQDGNPVVFILAANSEMSEGHVDEIRLLKDDGKSPNDCKRITAKSKDFRTKSGINLGMTEKALEAILGKPTFTDGELRFYSWQDSKELKSQDPDYSSCYKTDGKAIAFLTSFITARISNGILEWVTISSGSKYECPY